MLVEVMKYRITGIHGSGELYLEYRGEDSWAITDGVMCMSHYFYFEYEPTCSNRTDEFLKEFRFTFEEALKHIADLSKRNLEQM